MSSISISPEVAAVLNAAEVSGSIVRLTGTLDRKLYEATNKILEALGGKWDRKSKGHVFPIDAERALGSALENGSAVKRQQALQFFQTPGALARRMVELAQICADDDVLEPSAGHGRLLLPLEKLAGLGSVVAVEIDEANCRVLTLSFSASVHQADFLKWSSETLEVFDVALMNPPFSGNQDVAHMRAAWSLLRSGGRMVAIASEHGFIGQERVAQEFRSWLADINATVEQLPPGTFSESGTMVGARLIVALKP